MSLVRIQVVFISSFFLSPKSFQVASPWSWLGTGHSPCFHRMFWELFGVVISGLLKEKEEFTSSECFFRPKAAFALSGENVFLKEEHNYLQGNTPLGKLSKAQVAPEALFQNGLSSLLVSLLSSITVHSLCSQTSGASKQQNPSKWNVLRAFGI